MVEERKDLFFSLNVSIQICSKNSFLSDSFQGIELIFSIFFDQIDFSKGSFSNSFIKFKTRKSDNFCYSFFFHELVNFKNILLSSGHLILLFFLIFILIAIFALFALKGNAGQMQHFFNHCPVVRSVSVERVGLYDCTFSDRREYFFELVGGKVDGCHSIGILQLVTGSVFH